MVNNKYIENNSFIKNLSIVGISVIISQFLNFLFFIITARYYSQNDYGRINYVIQMSSLIATIIVAGFPAALVRFLSKYKENPKKIDEYFSNILTVTIGLLIIILFSTIIIFGFDIEIISIILGCTIVNIYLGVIRGFFDYKKISIFNILSNLFKVIPLIILCYILIINSVPYVVLLYAFAPCIAIIIIEILHKTNINYSLNHLTWKIFKEITIFSIPVLISMLAYTTLSSIPLLAIKFFYNYELVGIYSVAITISTIFSLVPEAIVVTIKPIISYSNNKKRRIEYIVQSIWILLVTDIIIYTVLVLFGKSILEIIFTSKYIDSYQIMLILSIGAIFAGIRNTFGSLWEGSGHPIIGTIDITIASIICISSSVLLVPKLGPMGAAYGYSLGFIVAVLIDLYYWIKYRYNDAYNLD